MPLRVRLSECVCARVHAAARRRPLQTRRRFTGRLADTTTVPLPHLFAVRRPQFRQNTRDSAGVHLFAVRSRRFCPSSHGGNAGRRNLPRCDLALFARMIYGPRLPFLRTMQVLFTLPFSSPVSPSYMHMLQWVNRKYIHSFKHHVFLAKFPTPRTFLTHIWFV
jgi:hypothetical protein